MGTGPPNVRALPHPTSQDLLLLLPLAHRCAPPGLDGSAARRTQRRGSCLCPPALAHGGHVDAAQHRGGHRLALRIHQHLRCCNGASRQRHQALAR